MTDPRPSMSAHEPDERLCDWVDGRMSPRELERFEAELRVNPRLRTEADAYRRSVLAMQRALRAEQPKVALADRILAAVRAEAVATPAAAPPVRSWSWRRLRPLPLLGSLAAAVLFVAAALWLRDFGSSAAPAATARPVAELPRDRGDAAASVEQLAAREPQELLLRGGVESTTAQATGSPVQGGLVEQTRDDPAAADAARPAGVAPGVPALVRPADSEPAATGSGAPGPVVTGRFAEADEQASPGRPVPDAGAALPNAPSPGSPPGRAEGVRGGARSRASADGAPRDGAPRDGAPRDGAPRDGASGDGTPGDGVPPPLAGAPLAKAGAPIVAAPAKAAPVEVAPLFPVLWFAAPSGAVAERREVPTISAVRQGDKRGLGEGGAGGGAGSGAGGVVALDEFLAAQFSPSGATIRQRRLALVPASGDGAAAMRVEAQASARADSALHFATATPEAVTTLTPMAWQESGGSGLPPRPQTTGAVPATDNVWLLEGPREQVAAVLGQLGQQAASNGIEIGNAEIPVPALTTAADSRQPASEPTERPKAATRRGGLGEPAPVPPQAVEPPQADADPKSARVRVVLMFGAAPAAGVEATADTPAPGTAPGGGRTDQKPPR